MKIVLGFGAGALVSSFILLAYHIGEPASGPWFEAGRQIFWLGLSAWFALVGALVLAWILDRIRAARIEATISDIKKSYPDLTEREEAHYRDHLENGAPLFLRNTITNTEKSRILLSPRRRS